MKFVLFYHSLISDWNHGNAHFLRGVASELIARGHAVEIYEPAHGWSRTNLLAEFGETALKAFSVRFPRLRSRLYDAATIDLDRALDGADVVIVHEWNEHDLVARIGRHHRGARGQQLLFHDTHHRSVTAPEEMRAYDLSDYDGVLAFGDAVRKRYVANGWCERAWTWHEAADVRVFRPQPAGGEEGDLIWIGNWGDGERARELGEFLVEPVAGLGLRTSVYGVRYPRAALDALDRAGIAYRGWLPNACVPGAFARHRATVHVPRRPYVEALPGIPTIRMFEALACGIPLVSAPWDDVEGLFTPGADYLVATDGADMRRKLRVLLRDRALATQLATRGLRVIRERHTCAHRVDELLRVLAARGIASRRATAPSAVIEGGVAHA
jgi:spore maturation protein CgeB